MTRRVLLRNSAFLALVTTSASGCSLLSTDPDQTSEGGGGGAKGKEAPMLAERVKAGTLPPVEERLPADPLVLEPTEGMGAYGGTWRSAVTGGADGPWLHRTIGYEPLMRWSRDWTTQIPNVAESITPNDDASEYTIALRPGMRWSDGEPLTTADVEFGYQHVTLNRDLVQGHPETLARGEDPAELEIVDEHTFLIRFTGPNALFLPNMARTVDGDRLVAYPRHYLEQFHADFAEDAGSKAQAAGFNTWEEYFNSLGNDWGVLWTNPDLPSLKAWICTDPLDRGSVARFERNPYYFKTDPEGSQLPYLDDVRYEVVPDPETMLLRAQNGDFDFHSRHFNSLENRPVLAESREKGDYRFIEFESTYSNEMAIALNLNHADEAVREVYQQKDFRVALSHAIDRQELINAVWQRQGEPYQVAPTPESRFYDQEFAEQYTEHDPELAEDLLDSLGYDSRDSDGYRLRPDGQRISITVDVAEDALVTVWVQGMEQVARYWEAVGIQTTVNPMPRENFEVRLGDNKQDASVWTGDGGRGDEISSPLWYFPHSTNAGSDFARHWANWYRTRGQGPDADTEEPPEVPRRQMALFDELLSEPDEDARDEIFREILALSKEQFYAIGTVRVPGSYGIVSNRLQNVGGPLPDSPTYNTPAPAAPEQWYFEG
ncbi:ABC transporter substrate-binding protein [Streptomyces sp. ACA25]|uniref:ABC transporter substrate-binding protein n=1 Tax=Streptomyces sp. ACA25 TaxID=3022596 RepID=UPI002306F183|nr:ABC transporter substrate-binding protein [Streptomyces sp. ACA25]MDB1090060.1 ABC transporter substrate-binding protein [Streptomyces sp. ACA25]